MLVELGEHVYTYNRPNGTSIKYNVDSLIDYMLSTGDFSEPESRIAFTDEELLEMDSIAKQAKLGRSSVHEAKKCPEKYKERRLSQDALFGVECILGEIVAEMLHLIECVSLGEILSLIAGGVNDEDVDEDEVMDPEEAQLKLILVLFPAFVEHYEQLKAVDEAFATQSIRSYKTFIRGPPNKPTRNAYGFKFIVLDFLSKCEKGIYRSGSF